MTEVFNKSVLIEGDKQYFSSKGAIDRLKRDLKNNDQEKLSSSEYFREGWTYQLMSQTQDEIKIKIVNKKDPENKEPRVLECDERRQLLKNKLKQLREDRSSVSLIKNKSKVEVSNELVNTYMMLKRAKLPISIPEPSEVLSNPEKYKNIVYTMMQSFGIVKNKNNIVYNYYKLLAESLYIPTNYQPINNPVVNNNPVINNPVINNPVINNNNPENNKLDLTNLDSEMEKIYQSLGINQNQNQKEIDLDIDTDITNLLNKKNKA